MPERARRPRRQRPGKTSRRPTQGGWRGRLAGRRRTTKKAAAPRSRSAYTGRAVILAVALASVMLALALPLKVFVSQRHAISRLEEQTRQQQARVDALKAEQQRWNDPAYVAAQARERLHFVKPGETAYIVLGDPAPAPRTTAPATAAASTSPWYTQLWRSVQLADHPAAAKKPARR